MLLHLLPLFPTLQSRGFHSRIALSIYGTTRTSQNIIIAEAQGCALCHQTEAACNMQQLRRAHAPAQGMPIVRALQDNSPKDEST